MDKQRQDQDGTEGAQLLPPGQKRLMESGLAFSAGALLVVLLSLLQQLFVGAPVREDGSYPNWYIYLLYLIPQLAFLGAAALYFVRSKEPIRRVYAGCKPRYFVIAILLQFGLLFSLSELNTLFIGLLGLLGFEPSTSPIPDLAGWNLLPAILVIGLLPAVFEELLFRGLLTRGMAEDGWGLLPTLLVSGALFSLYHGNPEQTVYQFLCGICFALMAIRAGSVLPSMLAHFLNNAVILALTSFGAGDLSVLPTGGYIALVVFSALCLIGALVYLVFWEKRGNRRGGIRDGVAFSVAAGGGILICAIEWIFSLVMGFV